MLSIVVCDITFGNGSRAVDVAFEFLQAVSFQNFSVRGRKRKYYRADKSEVRQMFGQVVIQRNKFNIIFTSRMAEGGEDYDSTSDQDSDDPVFDLSDGESGSDDVTEDSSEDDDVENLCKKIKKLFSVVVSLER